MLPSLSLFWLAFCQSGPQTPSVLKHWEPGHSWSFPLDLLSFILPSLALLFCKVYNSPLSLGFFALGPHCVHACAVTVANPQPLPVSVEPCWGQRWPLFLLVSPSLPSKESPVWSGNAEVGQLGICPAYELTSHFVSECPILSFLSGFIPGWVSGSWDFTWSSKVVACPKLELFKNHGSRGDALILLKLCFHFCALFKINYDKVFVKHR